jgi:phospholipid/cholesterol/gamma-HCH transport system substrate-binding protein
VKALDRRSMLALSKLAIFMVVTTMATSVLVLTIGNLSFADKTEYHAIFSDVTAVVEGDDVRIAGVRVGSVTGIDIEDRDLARVSFEVDSSVSLTQSTQAQIRYRNLIGQRYIALSPGEGSTASLEDGDTIPLSQTAPALDLTVLFQGFQPLFQAMSPEDVNKLAFEIIQVLQGEGGTVENLLARTSSLTQELANRDRLIGDTIDNLNGVLTTFGAKDEELSQTITTLQQFATGLKNDRQAILGSLDAVSELAVETADLVSDARPALTEDVRQLRRLAGNLASNKAVLDRELQILPLKLRKLGNTADYGSWFNFYLCNFHGEVIVPPGLGKQLGQSGIDLPRRITIDYPVGADRCSL